MPGTESWSTASAGLAHGWTGASSGPVTVVLHGGGPGCHAISDFAAVMALRPGRRWLWVDLPGYGASPPCADTTQPRIAEAADALDRSLDRLELDQVDVLAQSFGGSVALRLAAARPERINRIMLIGSQPIPGGTPGLGAQARAKYYGGDGPSPEKIRALMTELEWYDGSGIPESTVWARYTASITPAALANATAAVPAEDLTEELGSVSAPTLVVWGRHDLFAGPDYAAMLADALPRGDLAVIGRTAHHPQAERPDTVAAFAEAHLTQRS